MLNHIRFFFSWAFLRFILFVTIFLAILWVKSLGVEASSVSYKSNRFYIPSVALDWSNVVEFDVFFPVTVAVDNVGDNYLQYDFRLNTNLSNTYFSYWYTEPEFVIMGDTLKVSYRNQGNYFYVYDSGYFDSVCDGYIRVRMHLQKLGADEIFSSGTHGLTGSFYNSTYISGGTFNGTISEQGAMLHNQYVLSANTYYVEIEPAGTIKTKPIATPKQTVEVKDSIGNTLQQQSNTIQKEQAELQKEANEIQKEQAETSKNIFEKISDFFAGFFDGIINAVKSLFIPDDTYFSDFFTRLNDFFSEKLGALYAPIDILIRFMEIISNASASPPGIEFPGVKWEDTYIIQPQTISLTEYSSLIPGLQDKVYFITNVIIIGSLLWLLQVKIREVLVD